MSDVFEPKESVAWIQTQRGGYGFQRAIPAVFVRHFAGGMAQIAVQRTDGTVVKRRVALANLRAGINDSDIHQAIRAEVWR